MSRPMTMLRSLALAGLCALGAGGALAQPDGAYGDYVDPYGPQTVGPRAEVTGDYSQPYLYSPATGQVYADPMYYYGLRQLAKWDAIKPRSSTARASRKRVVSEESTEVEVRRVSSRRASARGIKAVTRTKVRVAARAGTLPEEVSDK